MIPVVGVVLILLTKVLAYGRIQASKAESRFWSFHNSADPFLPIVGHSMFYWKYNRECHSIPLRELQHIHTIEECGGTMVPQFYYVTSENCLRIVGYCVKCGVDMWVEYSLPELEKLCPVSESACSAISSNTPSNRSSFEDFATFELPSTQKPN
jgi:hypothetical protein